MKSSSAFGRVRISQVLLCWWLVSPSPLANGAAIDQVPVLSSQVARLHGAGKYSQALPLAKKLLTLTEQAFGAEHANTAIVRQTVGTEYMHLGDADSAVVHLRRAMHTFEKLNGTNHASTLTTANLLASSYLMNGDYQKAEALFQRILAYNEKVFGTRHSKTESIRNLLTKTRAKMTDSKVASQIQSLQRKREQLEKEGKDDEVLPLSKQLLDIAEKELGASSRATGAALFDLASAYLKLEDFTKALPLAKRALTIFEKTSGGDARETLADASLVAMCYWFLGDFKNAESFAKQAYEAANRKLGKEHADTKTYRGALDQITNGEQPTPLYKAQAASLQQQAIALQKAGKAKEAAPLLTKAVEVIRRRRGEDAPDYALMLRELAAMQMLSGNLLQAEELALKGLEIYRRILPKDSRVQGMTLFLLGEIHVLAGHDAKAVSLLKEAADLRRGADEDRPNANDALRTLTATYYRLGEYEKAEPVALERVELMRKTVGDQHPDYAMSLVHLGSICYRMGENNRADPLLREALAIQKKALGEDNSDYQTTLNNLAMLGLGSGKDVPTVLMLADLFCSKRPGYDIDPSAEMDQFLTAQLDRMACGMLLAVALRGEVKAEAVYPAILPRKGQIFARQFLIRALRQEPKLASKFAELHEISGRFATLFYQWFSEKDPELRSKVRKRLDEVRGERDEAERSLAKSSAAMADATRIHTVVPADIQAVLSPDTALVDYVDFVEPLESGGFGPHRLVAFVLRSDEPITMVDLGETAKIETLVDQWRTANTSTATDAKVDLDQSGLALRGLLWQPLEASLKGASTVLVSPDRSLGRFPLAALPASEPGKYLIQERGVATIAVPQLLPHLLTAPKSEASKSQMLLVGGVDFNAKPGQQPKSTGKTSSLVALAGRSAARGAATLEFPQLPATLKEIEAISRVFSAAHSKSRVEQIDGSEATEQKFCDLVPKSSYVHLATHGFFAPSQLRSVLTEDRAFASLVSDEKVIGRWPGGFHPGVLSGIALAGANRGADDAKSDDGILTAVEAAELDLSRTDLVVMSACETGLGSVADGEGLLGLQRALQVAGARTVVASLWEVDDEATKFLMGQFYENLWIKKMGKLQALREAQLSILNGQFELSSKRGALQRLDRTKQPAAPEPVHDNRYLWAAWVLSGDPG